jgi:hypothetical protein
VRAEAPWKLSGGPRLVLVRPRARGHPSVLARRRPRPPACAATASRCGRWTRGPWTGRFFARRPPRSARSSTPTRRWSPRAGARAQEREGSEGRRRCRGVASTLAEEDGDSQGRRPRRHSTLVHAPPRRLTQRLVREAEAQLVSWTHPDPYTVPYMPGSSSFMRHVPPPLSVRPSSSSSPRGRGGGRRSGSSRWAGGCRCASGHEEHGGGRRRRPRASQPPWTQGNPRRRPRWLLPAVLSPPADRLPARHPGRVQHCEQGRALRAGAAAARTRRAVLGCRAAGGGGVPRERTRGERGAARARGASARRASRPLSSYERAHRRPLPRPASSRTSIHPRQVPNSAAGPLGMEKLLIDPASKRVQ